jgi:hypothetical protein
MEYKDRTMLAIAGSLEGIERMITAYFYGSQKQLTNETIVKETKKYTIKTWDVEHVDWLFVEYRAGRYRLLRK